MAAESRKEPGQEQADSVIDELIRDILADAGQSNQTRGTLAALMEIVGGSSSRPARTSTLEKLLLAETIASAIANALAPALAETLAPEIVKALDQYMSGTAARSDDATAAAGEGARKPATRQ
jgi:hypothetical protein